MSSKKYMVYGGLIYSKNDDQEHYIPAHKVAELYKVPPQECVFIDMYKKKFKIWDSEWDDDGSVVYLWHPADMTRYKGYEDLITLSPDPSGEYVLD